MWNVDCEVSRGSEREVVVGGDREEVVSSGGEEVVGGCSWADVVRGSTGTHSVTSPPHSDLCAAGLCCCGEGRTVVQPVASGDGEETVVSSPGSGSGTRCLSLSLSHRCSGSGRLAGYPDGRCLSHSAPPLSLVTPDADVPRTPDDVPANRTSGVSLSLSAPPLSLVTPDADAPRTPDDVLANRTSGVSLSLSPPLSVS